MFRFNTEKTKELSAPVDEVSLDAAQEQLIRELTELTSPAVGLDPIPCRGLWLRAVRGWQIANGRRAADVTRRTPKERAKAALEIRDHFVLLARELLRSPEQRVELSSAIEDAFALYMQKYNRRPR
ncbi:MAG: hypothetical protein U0414_39500 [Polyangiaceae bacterium]